MNQHFCADRSRCLEATPIGTAPQHSTYVLIECPTPWAANAGESSAIPPRLSALIQTLAKQDATVRFLLINQDRTQKLGCRSVIIYRAGPSAFRRSYDKYEFAVTDLGEAAAAIQRFFERRDRHPLVYNRQQDLLICTHGSHDQCCARYGNPFYAEAKQVIKTLADPQIRVWRSSHFGGHRFAPTAITFPDGRCYGRLNALALQSILSHTGDIAGLPSTYRGWGLLPEAFQVMEQALLQRFGWAALTFNAAHKILELDSTTGDIKALMQYVIRGEVINCYGSLALDRERAVELPSACHAKHSSSHCQYQLRQLAIMPSKHLMLDTMATHETGLTDEYTDKY